MAPDDLREDVIENDPAKSLDDGSADEKTWAW